MVFNVLNKVTAKQELLAPFFTILSCSCVCIHVYVYANAQVNIRNWAGDSHEPKLLLAGIDKIFVCTLVTLVHKCAQTQTR